MERRGFTLIEILLALLISALIMTAILSSIDYTAKAVDAVHNVIESEDAGPRILRLIERDLAALDVYDAADYTVFRGKNEIIGGADADTLDFLCRRRSSIPYHDLLNLQDSWSPLVEVGYRLRRHPRIADFLELYRREDFFADDKPFEDGHFSLLYDRIINFDVLYYAKPELDPTSEDEWDSADREALPYALEIHMDLEVQPRRSLESLGILGSNRSRLEFQDILALPEEERWVFRNRIHPVLPEPGKATGPGTGTGIQAGGPGGARPAGGPPPPGQGGGQDLPLRGTGAPN